MSLQDNQTNVSILAGNDPAEAPSRKLGPIGEPSHTYRVIELVGTSDKSIEDAIRNAVNRAHQTIRHLRWFEVARTSGHIEDGVVSHFQVTLKIGFTMEDGI